MALTQTKDTIGMHERRSDWTPREIGRIIVVLVALLSVLRAMPAATLQAQTPAPQGVSDYDIVLIIDESASMWERNDQALEVDTVQKNPGWRIVAANLLAGALGADQSSATYRLALIMFGTEAKVVFPMQAINTPQAQAAWLKAITDNHKNMDATNILPALQQAKLELDKAGKSSKAKKVVIFLSDGVCEPVPQTTVPQRRACEDAAREVVQHDFIQSNRYVITTVALTHDAWAPDPLLAGANLKNLWQEMALKTGGDYYEAIQAEGDLVTIFSHIQQRLFGLPHQPALAVVNPPAEQTITLTANLQQAGFAAVSDDVDVKAAIVRPDGTTVKSGDAGVKQFTSGHVQYTTVLHPAGGSWVVKSSGAGKLTLFDIPDDRIRYTVETLIPGRLHPQNKPMEIHARVLDSNNAAQSAQDFRLVVSLPSGIQATPTLTISGLLYSTVLSDTSLTGVYTLTFSGKLGQLPLNEQHTVNVQPLPWMTYITPQADSVYTGTVPVQAQIMMGAGQMNASQTVKQLQVVGHMIASNGQEVDTVVMQPVASGVFSGTLFADAAGPYTARIGLTYNTDNGDKYQESNEVSVVMNTGGIAPLNAPALTSAIVSSVSPVVTAAAPVPVQTASFDPTTLYIAIAVLAGIMLLLLIVMLLQVYALGRIKTYFSQSISMQNKILEAWHMREFSAQLSTEQGWKNSVDQIVADAMKEAISIDGIAGILDISTEPSPKFTVLARDGRQIVFTTNPRAMKKMRLIQRGDKVVDISRLANTTQTEMELLWMYAQDMRNIPHVAAPVSTHWYVILRAADAGVLTTAKGLLRPGFVPYLEQEPQPPPSGDNA